MAAAARVPRLALTQGATPPVSGDATRIAGAELHPWVEAPGDTKVPRLKSLEIAEHTWRLRSERRDWISLHSLTRCQLVAR